MPIAEAIKTFFLKISGSTQNIKVSTPYAAPKPDLNKFSDRKVMQISEYQFQNLIKNPVRFIFLDLRDPSMVFRPFPKSQFAKVTEVRQIVEASGAPKEYPVLIICETGEVSLEAGNTVADAGYVNVTTLEGGTTRLSTS